MNKVDKFNFTNPYAEKFNEYLKEIEEERDKYSKRTSELDKAEQQVLHYIENKEMTDEQCVKIVTFLKSVRKERRESKMKLQWLGEIRNRLKKQIDENVNCSFKYTIDFDKLFDEI